MWLLMVSGAANLILLAGLVVALRKLKTYREDRKKAGLLRPWPVPQIDLDRFDPRFATSPLGPRLDSEIRTIAAYRVLGGISDLETWILCNLAKTAERILEIGTATGKTTYLLAANSPPSCRITTLTLKPEQAGDYKEAAGDDAGASRAAAAESAVASFFYADTPEAAKIEQLFGDSKDFDDGAHLERFDLIFVDGSHARSYVDSDSRKAIRMLKPGGIVLWHDYHGPRRAPGVFQSLNQLLGELPLRHLKGTSLVAYRKPGPA